MTGSLCKGWRLFQEKSSTFCGVTLFPFNRNERNFRNIKWYLLVVQLNATIFFFGTRNRKQTKAPSIRIRWIQAANESATFWSCSPEWKFLNTLWIRNRVYAKSGYFLSGDVTRSSPVFYRQYSRWCRPQCHRFFNIWTSVSSLITYVQFNQA